MLKDINLALEAGKQANTPHPLGKLTSELYSKMVEEKAKKYGLSYHSYPSFLAAVASHYRLLKKLGKKPVAVNTPGPIYATS